MLVRIKLLKGATAGLPMARNRCSPCLYAEMPSSLVGSPLSLVGLGVLEGRLLKGTSPGGHEFSRPLSIKALLELLLTCFEIAIMYHVEVVEVLVCLLLGEMCSPCRASVPIGFGLWLIIWHFGLPTIDPMGALLLGVQRAVWVLVWLVGLVVVVGRLCRGLWLQVAWPVHHRSVPYFAHGARSEIVVCVL